MGVIKQKSKIDKLNIAIYTTFQQNMYSKKLSKDYSNNRNLFTATDKEVFSHVLKMGGVQNKDILDFGCGNGIYSLKFIEMGAKSVVGIDTSEDMINLTQTIKNKKVSFIQSEENTIPIKNKKFDIIFSNFVFHHIKKLDLSLKEIFRVMKKEATLIATMSSYDFDEKFLNLKDTHIPIKLESEKTHIVVRNLVKHPNDIKRELKEAGFDIKIFKKIKNKNASISEEYKQLDKVKKLTLLIVASKI